MIHAMKHVVVALIVTVSVTASASQRGPKRTDTPAETGGYTAQIFRSAARTMPYRLFVPKGYDARRRYPLVVWLHGAGGAGTDNLQQISGDQVAGTRLWVKPETQAANAAFVVAPQSATAWVPGSGLPALQPDVQVVAALLDALVAEFPIDRRRVYVIGQSLGGGAAWNLAIHQPERLAGVVLVCPSRRDVSLSAQAAKVPLWVFQGDQDGLIVRTRELIDRVTKGGGHPRFTVYPKQGHDIWTRAFAEPGLVEWVFARVNATAK